MTSLTDDILLDCGGDAPPVADMRAEDMPDPAVSTIDRLRTASVCASLALHLAVAAVAVSWVSQRSGLIHEDSPAISIELALSGAVEQLPAEEVSDVVQDAAKAVAASEDPAMSELKPAEAEAKPLASSDAAAQGVETIEGSAPPDDAAGKAVSLAQRPETKPQPEIPKEPAKEHKKSEPIEKQQPMPRKAASAADPSVGAKAKAPRVSASTGSVLDYASRVRAKVSGHVPRSGAGKGAVVVSFGVTMSGGLSYARIAQSSGNAATDRAVLAGVRSAAPFPSPPAGASPSQLRFSVSFHFR